jgi:hypothetical protein
LLTTSEGHFRHEKPDAPTFSFTLSQSFVISTLMRLAVLLPKSGCGGGSASAAKQVRRPFGVVTDVNGQYAGTRIS